MSVFSKLWLDISEIAGISLTEFTSTDKPPIEELQQFLEFQLPRQWAPAYGDLPLAPRRKKQASPSLQFTLMGPKLYVNTIKVDFFLSYIKTI